MGSKLNSGDDCSKDSTPKGKQEITAEAMFPLQNHDNLVAYITNLNMAMIRKSDILVSEYGLTQIDFELMEPQKTPRIRRLFFKKFINSFKVAATVENIRYLYFCTENPDYIRAKSLRATDFVKLTQDLECLLNQAANNNKRKSSHVQISATPADDRLPTEVGNEKVCPICIFNQVDVMMPCLHSYCNQCITDWNMKSLTCPICRCLVEDGCESNYELIDALRLGSQPAFNLFKKHLDNTISGLMA